MFKNPRFFSLDDDFNIEDVDFESSLNTSISTPLLSHGFQSIGWSRVFFEPDNELSHRLNNDIIVFKLHFQDKVIPAAVVNEKLETAIIEYIASESEIPKAAWKKDKKVEIINDLLPTAFVKSSYTWAYIDLKLRHLVVDSASEKKSDTLIDLMVRTVPGFKYPEPISWEIDSDLLTAWVRGTKDTFDAVDIDDQCQIRIHDKGIVKCNKIDLTHEGSLDDVYSVGDVVSLALSWGAGAMTFTVAEDVVMFKSIKINEMPKPVCRETIIEGFLMLTETMRETVPMFSGE